MTSYEIIHSLAGINSQLDALNAVLSEQDFEHFEAHEITKAIIETASRVDKIFTNADFQRIHGSPKRALERFDGVQQ